MATNEGSDNNMQFFFTLDQTPELQNTHTIFGKVTGETIYNMIKLNDTQTDANERPLYPHKINKVKILNNPFPDLQPRYDRMKSSKDDAKEKKKKDKREGVKNFKLISFGDQAEQDEMEVVSEKKDIKKIEPRSSSSGSTKKDKKEKERKRSETPPLPQKSSPIKSKKPAEPLPNDESSDSDFEATLEKEKVAELEKKKKEIQDQIKDIKKQYHKDKMDKNREKEEEQEPKAKRIENEAIQDYLDEKEKYKKVKSTKKGASRENFTLSLLEKFKTKLQSATKEKEDNENAMENSDDETWLSHKLDFSESQDAILAKDASKKSDEW